MTRSVRTHEDFMREALRLARRTRTLPYPNPWVGCVIVRHGRIVGRGFHRGAGTPHAETEALNDAGCAANGATLYVTLEPCCHYGRTPPCTDAILRAGIRELVYAIRDPNPEVSGRGAAVLRARGVRVVQGVCMQEAKKLNEVYLKFRATGLPFVTVKVAASLDGKIATRSGESKWITNASARRLARALRGRHQAVIVGINTVLADDPHLGPRVRNLPEPWRVILDSHLRIPPNARVLRSGRCIVGCTSAASGRSKREIERLGGKVWTFPGKGRIPLKMLARRLASEGIISVLVEGGSEVFSAFFDQGLVDRICWFVSPMIIGSAASRAAIGGRGAARLADAWRIRNPKVTIAGNSFLLTGNLSRWAQA